MKNVPNATKKKSGQPARHEIEVKLRIQDREALLRNLSKLKAKAIGPRVHEMNTLYDAEDGRLAQAGQMARIRIERPSPAAENPKQPEGKPKATLTFKGPPKQAGGAYKVREEHEVQVASGEVLDAICRGLGLRPWFRYEKYRTPLALPGIDHLIVDLDETPIGDFVELEGSRQSIDRAARLLGFRKTDYITRSYGGLFMDSLRINAGKSEKNELRPGLKVPDMLFPVQKSEAKHPAGTLRHKIKKN